MRGTAFAHLPPGLIVFDQNRSTKVKFQQIPRSLFVVSVNFLKRLSMPSDTSSTRLTHVLDGHVATITINRAHKRNAINSGMWRHLSEIIKEIESNSTIRLIVVTGNGPDFSAGADISEFEDLRSNAEGARDYDRVTEAAYDGLRECPIPTLAAIQGSCMGGGLGLAMSCDLRIATPNARFAIPAGRLGLAYPVKSLVHLTGIVGPAVAKDLLFTARRYDAPDALRAGLLTEICEGSLEDEIEKFSRQITANAPLTLKASKAVINTLTDAKSAISGLDFSVALDRVQACYSSLDYVEGRVAFLAKRTPDFQGK